MNIKKHILRANFVVFAFVLGLFAIAGVSLAAVPVANLNAADTISYTSANLSVSVQSSSAYTVIFQYSTDASFGSGTQTVTLGSNVNATTITGLTAGTTYYYRAQVSNADGSVVVPLNGGGYQSYYSFKTLSYTSAYAETLGATNESTTSLTLNGRVNTYGAIGTYYFKYYSDSSCSTYIGTVGSGSLSAQSSTQYLTASLTGLTANTSYCGELIVTINGVTSTGGKVVVRTTDNLVVGDYCFIISFTSSNGSASVSSGSPVTLSWNVVGGCSSISISPDIGSVKGILSHSVVVYPTISTTYTLSAYGSTSGSQSVYVSVTNYNPNPNPNPNPYPCGYYYACPNPTPNPYPCSYCQNGSGGSVGRLYNPIGIDESAPVLNTGYVTPLYTVQPNQVVNPISYYNSYVNTSHYAYADNTNPIYYYNPAPKESSAPKYVYNKIYDTNYATVQDQPSVVSSTTTTNNTTTTGPDMNRYNDAYYQYQFQNDNLNSYNGQRANLAGAAFLSGTSVNLIEILIIIAIILLVVYLFNVNKKPRSTINH